MYMAEKEIYQWALTGVTLEKKAVQEMLNNHRMGLLQNLNEREVKRLQGKVGELVMKALYLEEILDSLG